MVHFRERSKVIYMSVITVSKTDFKPKAFEYLRKVEKHKRVVQITNHGRPVVEIVPFQQSSLSALKSMRGLVKKYDSPTEPVDETWDAEQ